MLFARFLKKTDHLLNICKQPTLKQLDFGLPEPVFLLIYTICSLRAFCWSKSLPHGLSPTLTEQGKVCGVIKKHTIIEVSSLFFFFQHWNKFPFILVLSPDFYDLSFGTTISLPNSNKNGWRIQRISYDRQA